MNKINVNNKQSLIDLYSLIYSGNRMPEMEDFFSIYNGVLNKLPSSSKFNYNIDQFFTWNYGDMNSKIHPINFNITFIVSNIYSTKLIKPLKINAAKYFHLIIYNEEKDLGCSRDFDKIIAVPFVSASIKNCYLVIDGNHRYSYSIKKETISDVDVNLCNPMQLSLDCFCDIYSFFTYHFIVDLLYSEEILDRYSKHDFYNYLNTIKEKMSMII